ncbi:lysozyme-like protein 7 [Ditylenchus destructor]|uniref:Lysozyme-like protein 7 n=1 Tax=Ditylenchus destructor TaxID=166010 RepID=A0AAD4NL08_9BILA|nr:lysozyme-like protein 7 [Ditylenchus destructor]
MKNGICRSLLFNSVLICFAILVAMNFAASATSTKTFGLGLDVNSLVSKETFQCIKNASYSVAFVQVYHADDGGSSFDTNAKDNIHNALKAKIGVEIYVRPNMSVSAKPPAQQFDETKKSLMDKRISFGTVWLMVTTPMKWSVNTSANLEFINGFLNRARSAKHYVGIYTSWYDWQLITGSYTGIQNNGSVMLWYWSTLGIGSDAVSSRDFDDFRPFTDWWTPTVKQFGIEEELCGVTVNRETFVNGTTKSKSKYKINTIKNSMNERETIPTQIHRSDVHFQYNPRSKDKLFYESVKNADGKTQNVLSAVVGHNFRLRRSHR